MTDRDRLAALERRLKHVRRLARQLHEDAIRLDHRVEEAIAELRQLTIDRGRREQRAQASGKPSAREGKG